MIHYTTRYKYAKVQRANHLNKSLKSFHGKKLKPEYEPITCPIRAQPLSQGLTSFRPSGAKTKSIRPALISSFSSMR